MRWPWSSRVPKALPPPDLFSWPELPDRPATDAAMRSYYETTAARLFDRGAKFLDQAANQNSSGWTAALTDLGKAYIEASASLLTLGERLGYISQGEKTSPREPAAVDE